MQNHLHFFFVSAILIFASELLVLWLLFDHWEPPFYLAAIFAATVVIIVSPLLLYFHKRQIEGVIQETNLSQKQLELAEIVFTECNEAIMISDQNNRIIRVNPAFTEITGYTLEEVKGKNPHILSSGKHDKVFYQKLWQSLKENGRWSGEIWNRRKNGETYPEWLSINLIYDDSGNIVNHQAIFSDITSRKKEEARLLQLANYDALTGLPNRLLFHDRLKQAREVACRDMKSFAVLFVDLDYFKEVNDGMGHAIGDSVLQTVAKRIQSCVRATDTVSRYGGDEFLVILQDVDNYREIAIVVEKIIASVSQVITISDKQVHISASVGVSLGEREEVCSLMSEADLRALIERADNMMYEAKLAGRSTYRLPKRAMNDQ